MSIVYSTSVDSQTSKCEKKWVQLLCESSCVRSCTRNAFHNQVLAVSINYSQGHLVKIHNHNHFIYSTFWLRTSVVSVLHTGQLPDHWTHIKWLGLDMVDHSFAGSWLGAACVAPGGGEGHFWRLTDQH